MSDIAPTYRIVIEHRPQYQETRWRAQAFRVSDGVCVVSHDNSTRAEALAGCLRSLSALTTAREPETLYANESGELIEP